MKFLRSMGNSAPLPRFVLYLFLLLGRSHVQKDVLNEYFAWWQWHLGVQIEIFLNSPIIPFHITKANADTEALEICAEVIKMRGIG